MLLPLQLLNLLEAQPVPPEPPSPPSPIQSTAGGGGYGGIRHKYDDDDEIKERIKKIQQEEDELIINFVKAFMQNLNYN